MSYFLFGGRNNLFGHNAPFLDPSSGLPPERVIFGQSGCMLEIRQRIEKVAQVNVPVLIQGETGTGKEILSRVLHEFSPWKDGPFIKVSCPAIPTTLLESELFGYEKGAFTGASNTKPGKVEQADRGALFLDEIAELDPAIQAKLLHLLQDGRFCRIGAQDERQIDVRFICATHRDMEQQVRAGLFRQDVYYRINVVSFHVPPLRDRKEDILGLANYFLASFSAAFNSPLRPLSARLKDLLERYEWPGNIHELKNTMRRLVILGTEEPILDELLASTAKLPPTSVSTGGPTSLKKLTQKATCDLERQVIFEALAAHHWDRKQTARALRISYRALLSKIRKAEMARPEAADDATRPRR